MKVTHIYSILNGISSQLYGTNAIEVTDLSSMIAMGDSVLFSDTDKENFTDTLVDRIGKTLMGNRKYNPTDNGFLKDSFTFGAILQKIYVDVMDASESKHFGLTDGESVDPYAIKKPVIKQKLFKGITTWECDVTVTDVALKSAFTSATEMANLISSIFTAMENSIDVALESADLANISNFIARKVDKSNDESYDKKGVINLLTEYNTATAGALTSAEALRNKEFLKYASQQINLWKNRMKKMSVLFNDEGYKRFTDDSNMRILMLDNFSSAMSFYLESDTFNNELVKLPTYREMPYWLGSGKDYSFDSVSTVNVKLAEDKTVNQKGVVGIIADVNAIGITIKDRRTKSAYNEKGEYTNYFNKADVGYYNDLSENGIVFIVADEN